MTTLHAVVLSYWPARRGNVVRIVEDLRAGTVVPDRITILDNNPDFKVYAESTYPVSWFASDDTHDVVTSSAGTWTRGKFVAALLHPAKYYLMMDDDTSVGPRTVERLLQWADGRRGLTTGYWGVKLSPDDRFIAGAAIIQPTHLGNGRDVPVDGFHGRAMFMSYDAVVRMLAVEEFVRFNDDGTLRYGHEGDDILAGLANPPALTRDPTTDEHLYGTGSYVIPLSGDECFVDLSEEGQALQYQEGYFGERDRFCQDAVAVIRRRGVPRW